MRAKRERKKNAGALDLASLSLSPPPLRAISLLSPCSSTTQQRKDVEGSLFVVRRAASAGGGCAVVILNKKAGPNWAEPLRPECQFEAAPPYLLTRTAGDAVVGVWFYDAAECERVGALLVSLAAGGQAAASAPPALPTPTPRSLAAARAARGVA